MLLDPVNVLLVGGRCRQTRLVTFAEGVIKLEHVSDDEKQRPPIKQHVRVTPDELVTLVGEPNQKEAHERGLGQIEAEFLVFLQKLPEPLLLIIVRKLAPVVSFNIEIHATIYNLQRFLESLPDEGRPEYGVPSDDLLPRTQESTVV